MKVRWLGEYHSIVQGVDDAGEAFAVEVEVLDPPAGPRRVPVDFPLVEVIPFVDGPAARRQNKSWI